MQNLYYLKLIINTTYFHHLDNFQHDIFIFHYLDYFPISKNYYKYEMVRRLHPKLTSKHHLSYFNKV